MIDNGRPYKVLREYNFQQNLHKIFKGGINFFEDIFPAIIHNLRFFLILNPYNFVPLTAHIKLEIYSSNELEHKCSQEVSLMALNDTFTIQEINLDKKELSFDNKLKKIESYWNNECAEHPSNNHCKIFCD